MDWLEQELKQALARKEPSPDFAARVAMAAERPQKEPPKVWVMPRWLAAAAIVGLPARVRTPLKAVAADVRSFV